MSITFGDYLIDSGYYDITPEQEREIDMSNDGLRTLDEAEEQIERLNSRMVELMRQLEDARRALKGCQTSYNGYAITKSEQYPELLASFWKEIQRIDRIARLALSDEKGE